MSAGVCSHETPGLGLTDQSDTDAVILHILFNWPKYERELNMKPAHFLVMFSSQTK